MSLTNSAPEHFIPKSDNTGNLVPSRFSDGDLDGGTNSHIDNTVGPIRIGDCQDADNGTRLALSVPDKRLNVEVNPNADDNAQLLMEVAGAAGAFLAVRDGTRNVGLALSSGGNAQLGTNGGNNTKLELNDSQQQLVLQALTVEPESDGVTGLGTATKSFKRLFLDSSITDELTGDSTINKACGTVWFAAGASELTVTNNLVTATSFVFPVVHSNDATAKIKNVTRRAGLFTIRLEVPATNDTEVAFWVLN